MNSTTLKPRLILLSDIWGKTNWEWISYYIDDLSADFDIKLYDVCELAAIDRAKFTAEEVHQEFINGGIDFAVKQLLQQEQETAIVLGFSIGGLIAWKASLTGLKTSHLLAISSTRLRYETEKPKGDITLFYGSLDPFIPTTSWFDNMKIETHIYQDEVHEMYRKEEIARSICNQILVKPIF